MSEKLPDHTLQHLRDVIELPDTSGTRYDVIEPIARGGMGVVFRAHDRTLARDVALKVLSVRDTREETRARMLTEAHVLARLEHPGIVPVHDVGILSDGRAYYAMKLVRGSRLEEHALLNPDRPGLLRIFVRVCDAVAFAHAQGVVHRDLKPENIMIGDFGEALVMDWGVAKLLNDPASPSPAVREDAREADSGVRAFHRTTGTGAVVGTPGYMSPEQARGESARVDTRSDVYALGAILGFLAEMAGPVPRRLRAIVDCATAQDPAARYPGATALAEDVSRYADGLAVSAYREPWWEKAARVVARHRIAFTLISAYLIMRILIFLLNRF